MQQRCEVCENFRPDTEFPGDRKTSLIAFDVRPVRLCAGHARIARSSGVTSFEELRELYGSGRRSFVPRRSEHTPTAFGETRASPGRRATDRLRLGID
jgi:hypothetical protein